MTEYQIEQAARLWRQGFDTFHIARQVCPKYNSVRGTAKGGEADVYNNLARIRDKAREPISISAARQ